MFIVIALVAVWIAHAQLGLDPHSSVIVGALAAVAWLAFAAVFWPFTPCEFPGCDKGKVRRPGKRATYRPCWWCGGAGARLRWGRRLYDHLTRGRKA